MSQQFEWDAAKAATNVAEHGVTFEEALTVRRPSRADLRRSGPLVRRDA